MMETNRPLSCEVRYESQGEHQSCRRGFSQERRGISVGVGVLIALAVSLTPVALGQR